MLFSWRTLGVEEKTNARARPSRYLVELAHEDIIEVATTNPSMVGTHVHRCVVRLVAHNSLSSSLSLSLSLSTFLSLLLFSSLYPLLFLSAAFVLVFVYLFVVDCLRIPRVNSSRL